MQAGASQSFCPISSLLTPMISFTLNRCFPLLKSLYLLQAGTVMLSTHSGEAFTRWAATKQALCNQEQRAGAAPHLFWDHSKTHLHLQQ